MKTLQVAICGCGIAGLALGILLKRQGHHVIAYDQFENPAPVGSGFLLQPTGLAVLDALGLLEQVEKHGAVIERFFGREATSGRLVLDLRYDALGEELNGLAVQRDTVFTTLYNLAKSVEVQVQSGKIVTSSKRDGVRRRVGFADGTQSEPFDLVIDAMSQRSVLRPKRSALLRYGALWASLDWPEDAGLVPNAGEQRYHRSSKMIGIVPIGTSQTSSTPKAAFFWSIKGQDVDTWRGQPLSQWKKEVAGLWPETEPLLDQVATHDDLTFAQYRHSTLSNPVSHALAHIGDSYHATSPQLGQGANMALLDAYALSQGLEREKTIERAFDHYIWARAFHVRLFQSMSWAFTPVYQSDSNILPMLRDNVIAPLSKTPTVPTLLAKMVTGLLGNPLGRLGLHPIGAK